MERRIDLQNYQTGSGVQNNNAGGSRSPRFANFSAAASHPYKILRDKVSGVGASRTAEQQHERRECLEGTREKALGTLREWSSANDHPIFWLTGPTGVGKSTIAMSVAKSCERDSLVSSFFFSRSDPKRNNPSALFLAVAYGLVTKMPLLRNPIEQKISEDPMILEARMEDQFRELIERPLSLLPQKWDQWLERIRSIWGQREPNQKALPNLVIIDGLDECSDEETQSRVITTILSAFDHSPRFPLRFLICSRPESWIQEAFSAKSLQPLTKVVVLEDSFSPDEDIRRYYLHHFREIFSDSRYSQVAFPSPWPSEEDLELLVERSYGQFVYAVTAIKFIKGASEGPTEQLRVILKNIPPRQPGTSPHEQLDALYDYILSVNTEGYEKVRLILGAILVIPFEARTSACIELLLELPSGQVASTLLGMHTVLDIRGSNDKIRIFHTSFSDYLIDQTRSRQFYIDVDKLKHAIARRWLQNLSTRKMQTYSFNQLFDDNTNRFFLVWIEFCTSIPKPTRDLLDDLQNVDLASVFFCKHASCPRSEAQFTLRRGQSLHASGAAGVRLGWDETFSGLALWVDKFVDYESDKNMAKKGKATVEEGPESNEWVIVDHVGSLKARFLTYPKHFHLELSPGISLRDDIVYWDVLLVTGCSLRASLTSRAVSTPRYEKPLRLSDCRCDLSGGKQSDDPKHVAYQEACLELVRVFIFDFELLAKSNEELVEGELDRTFGNLTGSLLWQHCCLDEELLSLCQNFLRSAQGCTLLKMRPEVAEERKMELLRWIETLTDMFAEKAQALKAQLNTLTWKSWIRTSGPEL
ncbi:hypothetical protein PQX77_013148 [Marasmius sp. AFHP31]|nr:hypothetical protein PQX77_013148 [Marasmius sp. AFHP31]